MEVLVAGVQAFFFGLIGAFIASVIFYLSTRRKPDTPLILGLAIGIGVTRAIEAQWPVLLAYQPFVVCACVVACVGLAKLSRCAT